jgi:hypothetical protein
MTTPDMTVEWKTCRESIINSNTKGKNDRMAFAATENANVCTSVCNKYFTVESTTPGGLPVVAAIEGSLTGAGDGAGGDMFLLSYQTLTRIAAGSG